MSCALVYKYIFSYKNIYIYIYIIINTLVLRIYVLRIDINKYIYISAHKTYILITKDIDINIDTDIFVNCNWVDIRWQMTHTQQ